ncbi:hypothetical protein CCAL12920_00650 [Campylobacter sp. RM12920]|uniref:Holin n=1 Tax=Campylobacter californiensis TaxID=1032243 RepID=A0ABD4JFJ7_9BACT|nr:hypothetical protein [Campylobacter sp. RM9328]MBE2985562.1 hypothetical protein [Campylobacter sp. RM12919]MBE2987409.1 hypothetical protein [Campylobacter sp. RM12920]
MTSDILKEVGIYLWVFAVGLIGGLLNIGANPNKTTGHKAINFTVGVISSIFIGWVSFEVIRFIYKDSQVALAGAGFFAWKGTDWVNALTDKIIYRRLKKGDGDYDDIPPMPRNMKDEE